MELPTIPDEANIAIAKGIENGDHIVDLMLLNFSQRNVNILEQQGNIQNIEELVHMHPEDLLGLTNFGQKALEQLFESLARYHELDEIRTIKPIEGSKKKNI